MELILSIFGSANVRWVLAGTMLLGISSGVLGSFVVLRKQSLLGDAMSHAALPGICFAFLLTGVKSVGLSMFGAAVTALFGAWAIQFMTRKSRMKQDAALGIVLSVFFGFGVVLMTLIQNGPYGNHSGLDAYMLGQAASLVDRDVHVLIAVSLLLLSASFLFFKEFKLLSFDPGFGRGIGFPMGVIEAFLMILVTCAVVVGLQAVGVVLMAAMLITPAIAARYWTERLGVLAVLAGLFGGISGIAGTLVSALGEGLATGPLIVLSATGVFVISLLFGTRRGLVVTALRQLKVRREDRLRTLLEAMARDMEDQSQSTVTKDALLALTGWSNHKLNRVTRHAERLRLITSRKHLYGFTRQGLNRAYQIVKEERMEQLLLMYDHRFSGWRVARDDPRGLAAALSPSVVKELEELMETHRLTPQLEAAFSGEPHVGKVIHEKGAVSK